MAGDKYLLNHFSKSFFDYVKSKLNAESSCLIYDQLMKIGERPEIPLAEVRTEIIENSWATFESEFFKHIDQETLISLLSLNQLSIDEFDLLAAVSKWVRSEVQRQRLPVNQENRRKVFEPIKGYILFSALDPEKVANCKEIAELLTSEEIGLLLLHLMNKSKPLKIKQKTRRSAGANAQTVSVSVSNPIHRAEQPISREVYLTATRRVRLLAIHSTYSKATTNLTLLVQNAKTGVYLDLKTKRTAIGGRWSFQFSLPLDVKSGDEFMFKIQGTGNLKKQDQLSNQWKLKSGESVLFNLYAHSNSAFYGYQPNQSNYHFVRGLAFVPLD